MRIDITPSIQFESDELEESFVRASGPGGQNVNKVSTAVQVRLDLRAGGLPEWLRVRAAALGGRRVTGEGVLVIMAARFRSQDRNRQDALDRVVALLQQAADRPPIRRPTRPTLGSKRRRVDDKVQRGEVKKLRREPGHE